MAKADIHYSRFLEWEVKYIKDYGEDKYSLLIVIDPKIPLFGKEASLPSVGQG
jgi:hypothetical protein